MSVNVELNAIASQQDHPSQAPQHDGPPPAFEHDRATHEFKQDGGPPDHNATLYVFTRDKPRLICTNDQYSHAAIVLDVDVRRFPGLLEQFEGKDYHSITPQRLRDRLHQTNRVKILVSGYPEHQKNVFKSTALRMQPPVTETHTNGFLEMYRGYQRQNTKRTYDDSGADQSPRDWSVFHRTYAVKGEEFVCERQVNQDGTVTMMKTQGPPFLLAEEPFDRKLDPKHRKHVLRLHIDMDKALHHLAQLINVDRLDAEHLEYAKDYGDYLVIRGTTNKRFNLLSSVGYLLCCRSKSSMNCTTLVADLLDLPPIPSSQIVWQTAQTTMTALSLLSPTGVHFFTNINLLGDFVEDQFETWSSIGLIGTVGLKIIQSMLQGGCDTCQSKPYDDCFSNLLFLAQIGCLVTLLASYFTSDSGDRIRTDAAAWQVLLVALSAFVASGFVAGTHFFVQRQSGWVLRPMELYRRVQTHHDAASFLVVRALDETPSSSRLTYFPDAEPLRRRSFSSHPSAIDLENPAFEQEHKGSDDEAEAASHLKLS